ncbi:DUF502 domain-containing protein [candidate division KSB1 bacterium]|nr:DUF502 domain-containing protein [candidate division KSB1 bacterium]
MKKILRHLRRYIITGSLAVIPIFLVYMVTRFIYLFIDQNVMNLIDDFIGIRIPGLGLVITILLLYGIGLLSRNMFGKWLFNLFERIAQKIPIVGTTYHVGKQISNTLSLPEKQVFKKVVLVNYLKKDIYTIGFITGSLTVKNTNERLFKIFIPTPPNPTTGTIVIAKESEIIDPGWTIDEGFRTVISAGIIGPDEVNLKQS